MLRMQLLVLLGVLLVAAGPCAVTAIKGGGNRVVLQGEGKEFEMTDADVHFAEKLPSVAPIVASRPSPVLRQGTPAYRLQRQSPMTVTSLPTYPPKNSAQANKAAQELKARLELVKNSNLEEERLLKLETLRQGLDKFGRKRRRSSSHANKTGETINSTTQTKLDVSPEQRTAYVYVKLRVRACARANE